MISSVINEGARGLLNSQREMHKSANEIARANIRELPAEQVTDSEPSVLPPVAETQASTQRGIEASQVELKRQEQLFMANAQVVDVGSERLGSLINIAT